MKHVEALQYILGTAKKLVSFGSFLHIDVFLMLP